MASEKMMQGDSYPLFFSLKIDGSVIIPDMVEDILVCIGELLEYSNSAGTVQFDSSINEWYFFPAQVDTLALEPGTYPAEAHVKFRGNPGFNKKGIKLGDIVITKSQNKRVI